LAIAQDVIIAAPGADVLTVSGNNQFQVFNIAPAITVTISGLIIANGAGDRHTGGGGIVNYGTLTILKSTLSGNRGGGVVPEGGGIYNGGTLTIIASTLSGNSATFGGGIQNNRSGTLTIIDSTLSQNRVVAPAPLPGGGGAAIDTNGALTIINSTISGNSGAAFGGGIDAENGRVVIRSSTISDNTADGDGGGILAYSTARINISNTIIAGNRSRTPDVYGRLVSWGNNLIGIGAGGSGFAHTDLVGTAANPSDPKLGPLQDNGGPTPTMALLPGSPAIDAGVLTDSEWDQRGPGYARLVNGATDIGAYEVQDNGSSVLRRES
jgi:hypothetical protein